MQPPSLTALSFSYNAFRVVEQLVCLPAFLGVTEIQVRPDQSLFCAYLSVDSLMTIEYDAVRYSPVGWDEIWAVKIKSQIALRWV